MRRRHETVINGPNLQNFSFVYGFFAVYRALREEGNLSGSVRK